MQSTSLNQNVKVHSLPGLTSYAEVHALQLDLVQKRIQNEIPDTVIFCEHPPVVTRGRGLQYKPGQETRAILYSPPKDTEYFEIERGGDLTWHGPGQIVMYPIFSIPHDIDKWVRCLEYTVIDALADVGLSAQRKDGSTGVWVDRKKVASVGIAIKRWVSYHGVALNIQNDLQGFRSLGQPCGLPSEVMDTVSNLCAASTDGGVVRPWDSDWRTYWQKALYTKLVENLSKL